MDTSNSDLHYVRYGQTPRRVDHGQLDPHQWMRLILDLMQMQHSYKKYLPFLRDHKEAVCEICQISDTRSLFDRSVPEHVFYETSGASPPNLMAKDLRLLPLIPLYPWKANNLKDYSGDAWAKDVLKDDYLLFGTGWVKLHRIMARTWSTPQSNVIRVRSFTFSELSQEELISEIGDRTNRWCMLYDAFQALMLRAIKQKRQHMEQMERSYAAAAEVRERIHLPNPTF